MALEPSVDDGTEGTRASELILGGGRWSVVRNKVGVDVTAIDVAVTSTKRATVKIVVFEDVQHRIRENDVDHKAVHLIQSNQKFMLMISNLSS